MSRYYLLSDYLIPIYSSEGHHSYLPCSIEEKIKYYADLKITPKNYTLLKLDQHTEIRVVYYEYDIGHLLFKVKSRHEAYRIAHIIRGLLGNYYGWFPDDKSSSYYLCEFRKIPQPSWDDKELFNNIDTFSSNPDELLILELMNGYVVDKKALDFLSNNFIAFYNDIVLTESLNHLMESRFLFCGFMVGSYYHFHYSRDRKYTRRSELEKRYYENRYRYETSFLAAFKGIERYFSVNSINNKNVDQLFKNCPYKVSGKDEYIRFHEIFRGLKRKTTKDGIIRHFLNIRNIVAAHGNKNPPTQYLLSEDNVFEIQLFLSKLISEAL